MGSAKVWYSAVGWRRGGGQRDRDAEAIFWYLFEDESMDENPAGHFGLVEYDDTPKQSYYEYGVMTGS